MKNICNTSTEIASYISENDHQAAKKRLDFLMKQYPVYFPQYENPFEAKPGFFGFSIDLFKTANLLKSTPLIKKLFEKRNK